MAQSASSIVVEGNQRVDAETIRSYFQTSPGQSLTPAKIDEALKGLYATGLFSDVTISNRGGRMVVTVVENQVINRVAFEGNKKVKDDQLSLEVQSKARSPLSKTTVQADTQRIIDIYHRAGRYDVRVEPKIIERGQGRVDLVFEIKEGDKLGVAEIKFVGNKAYSAYKLKDEITTTETNWLSWLKNSDIYDVDRINTDQELLRRFYLKHGYADFRIISVTADLDRQRDGFVLTYVIDEGPQYRVGTVDVVSGIKDVDIKDLRAAIRVAPGQVYNAELVEKSVENATIEVSKAGYAFAQVRPRGDRNVETRTISLVFAVEEGPRVYVERIEIRGNTRTRDWVIRREFDFAEGDAYNRVLVDRAERRLRNLGYFKDVKITNEPGTAPDRIILVVTVEDQPTGEFSVSGGYSTTDGFIGEVAISEKNFLGRGQYVRLAGQLGENVQGADFSFTEPYFLDYRMAAGFDLFWKTTSATSYSQYDTETMGGTLRVALPLTDELTLGLRYMLSQKEISVSLEDEAYNNISWALLEINNEAILTSAVGYTLSYNMLDNNKNPSNGYLLELKQDFAGLGGDSQYIRTTFDARYYMPVVGDAVLLLRGQAGNVAAWGNEDLRITDNFFKGPDLVRGFAPNGIGPRDLASGAYGQDQDALGGTMFWGATAEVQFPLSFLPKDFGLKFAVFADAGSLWDYQGNTTFRNIPGWDNTGGLYPNYVNCDLYAGSSTKGMANVCVADSDLIRSSVGVSLIWASPFGPLRFDYAWALTKEWYDQVQEFRFSGGTTF